MHRRTKSAGPYVALTLLGKPPVHPSSSRAPDALEQNASPSHPLLPTPAAAAAAAISSPSPFTERDRISNPLAVDHDKDLLFRAQKLSTIQMMRKQVLEEFEKMKLEYQRNPTELLQNKLQVKLQTLRRVEDQLRTLNSTQSQGSPPGPDPQFPPESCSAGTPSKQLSSSGGASGSASTDVLENHEAAAASSSSSPATSHRVPSSFLRGPTPWAPSAAKHRKADSMPDTLYKIEEDSKDATSAADSGSTGSCHPPNPNQEIAPRLAAENNNNQSEEGDNSGINKFDASRPGAGLHGSTGAQVRSSSSGLKALPVTDAVCDLAQSEASFFSSDPTSPQQPLKSEMRKSPLKVVLPNQVKVVIMEDADFSTVDDPGIFSDLVQLKHRPAHLAVFLHYLVSNSDPAAMLFYLVTESYPLGSIKDMKKWAYEIFSTFLCDRAPLKINVDEATVVMVSTALQTKGDKEDAMKNVFHTARIFAQNEINDHLNDFRSKRALGLGSLYGDRDLKDNMDRQSEFRIIESALWKHFERLVQDEDTDRSQVMASALATFFKQVGYSNQKNNSLLDRCSSFNAKDRKVFKFKSNKKEVVHVNGHQFAPQQYFSTTFCSYCQNIFWGIGHQGFQCVYCETNLHRTCIDSYKEVCSSGSGTLRKKKERGGRPPSMFDLISRKLSNTNPAAIKEAQHQHFGTIDSNFISPPSNQTLRQGGGSQPEGHETDHGHVFGNISNLIESDKSPEDQKFLTLPSRNRSPDGYDEEYNPSSLGRSESLNQRSGIRASVRRAHSDVSPDNNQILTQPANSSGSSSNSSLSARTSDSSEGLNEVSVGSAPSAVVHKSQFSDSDFDVEPELPLLESVIPKELFRKLKPKKKKVPTATLR